VKLFDESGKKLVVRKASRWPKIGCGQKTCWMSGVVTIDGHEVMVHWECMRGARYYFVWKSKGYFMPFYRDTKQCPLVDNVEIDDETRNKFTTEKV